MKENKKKIIISSIITLLPMFVGILLWKKLPDTMVTHWGMNNTPDGFSSKAVTVFGLPLLLVAIHLICVTATLNDPKKKNIGKWMMNQIFWLVPILSVVVNALTYAYALGIKVDIGFVISILIGMLFILLGNYMSKNRQNYTVGIKIPWTLSSEENWNKTHRMASKLWMAAGVVFIVNAFLNIEWLVFVIIAITVLVPTGYSFLLYQKEK